MHRRVALHAMACGALGTITGCLGETPSGETSSAPPVSASVLEIETQYPGLSPTQEYWLMGRTPWEEPSRTPTPFSDLSPSNKFVAANAISRKKYITNQRPNIREEDRAKRLITYRDTTFGVGLSIPDYIGEPKHGPENDPEWRAPVDISGVVADGELTLVLTNKLDVPLAVHHSGRPYFGVLTAVNESAALLGNDHYDDNELIETSDVVRVRDVRDRPQIKDQTTSLTHGESIQEVYGLPQSLPDQSRIWLSIRIGDESVDLFGNHSTTLGATVPLRRTQ